MKRVVAKAGMDGFTERGNSSMALQEGSEARSARAALANRRLDDFELPSSGCLL